MSSPEFSKRIFPDFGITLGGEWNLLVPAPNNRTESGFGNLEVTLKYQFFTNAAHETILSAAFGWEAGGTGRQKAGAESFDIFRPAILFGKGMGDLPKRWRGSDPLLSPASSRACCRAAAATRSSPSTGTVNPGIIWAGKYFQIGLEAVVPINERTGKNVGIRGQLHFFLDDLFPNTLGRPLFGGR
ncbi:MAG TPA: hypothetical protein VMT97_16375 [Terriglobales bacterium]|nr:hypothetical protein [Terriglobales bacterium]